MVVVGLNRYPGIETAPDAFQKSVVGCLIPEHTAGHVRDGKSSPGHRHDDGSLRLAEAFGEDLPQLNHLLP